MNPDTPHQPDDELDDLFRRAAGAYQPPFDPQAWKQMEQKLNSGTQPLVRRLYLLGVIELVFVLAGLLLTWTRPERSVSREPSNEHSETVATNRPSGLPSRENSNAFGSPANPTDERAAVPSTGMVRNNSASEADTRDEQILRSDGRPSSGRVPSSAVRARRERGPAAVPTLNQPRNAPRQVSVSRSELVKNTRSQRPSRPAVRTRQTLWRASEEKPGGQRAGRKAKVALTDQATPFLKAVSPISVDFLRIHSPRLPRFSGVLPHLAAPVPPVKIATPRPRLARWSALAFAAPDYTNVPGRALRAPGYNVGAQLEFRPFPRWRLGLGAVYATKLYDATSYDYRPYPGYWQQQRYGRPDKIAADCRILELPLSIRYDVLQREGSTWSVSIGSSSYLMLNEEYQYQYPSGYKHAYPHKRTGDHYWATVNLSASYERKFSQRLALRVEPFVKMPQGGVGFGNVKLRTAGVAFGLRYDFPRR